MSSAWTQMRSRGKGGAARAASAPAGSTRGFYRRSRSRLTLRAAARRLGARPERLPLILLSPTSQLSRPSAPFSICAGLIILTTKYRPNCAPHLNCPVQPVSTTIPIISGHTPSPHLALRTPPPPSGPPNSMQVPPRPHRLHHLNFRTPSPTPSPLRAPPTVPPTRTNQARWPVPTVKRASILATTYPAALPAKIGRALLRRIFHHRARLGPLPLPEQASE